MKFIFVLACVLCACDDFGMSYDEIITPNGKPGASVLCGIGKADCYKGASRVCKQGYSIIREEAFSMIVECK